MIFETHVFVCLNERTPDDLRGCCSAKDSSKVHALLKEEIKSRGLDKKIRINKSGCLDQCSKGVTVVVYPEGVWYGHVGESDVKEIVEQHLIGGRPVERLRIG